MARIAGHNFLDDRCTECGREWIDIMHVDQSYCGEVGWAHSGSLNTSEASEIMAEKLRRDAWFARVLQDMRSG